jgi:PKD repeat protein
LITLNVTDAAGNSAQDTVTVTVRDTTPPAAEAGPDGVVVQDAPVVLDGGNSSDNVGIASYAWAFQDAGGPVRLDGEQVTYRFVTPGTRVVTLTVSDLAGNNATDTVTITVTDAEEPSVEAGADMTVEAGTTVRLVDRGSTDNVGIVSFEWRFVYGDHQVSLMGKDQSFKFGEAGTYNVTLTATDAAGNAGVDNIVVTVLPPGSDKVAGWLSWAMIIVAAAAIIVVAFVIERRKKD